MLSAFWTWLLSLVRRNPAPVLPPPPPVVVDDPLPQPAPLPVPAPPVVEVTPTDDTEAVQRLIDAGGTVELPDRALRLYDDIVLRDGTANLTLIWPSRCRFVLMGDGAASGRDYYGLRFQGLNRQVTLVGPKMRSGVVRTSARQTGIGCPSGQVVSGLTISDPDMEGLNVGISINANLGGSFERVRITNPQIRDMIGGHSGGGGGYGLHIAGARDVRVEGGSIAGCDRHGLYVGSSPKDENGNLLASAVVVRRTKIARHRESVHNAWWRCAVSVSRTRDVQLLELAWNDCYDGALEISADSMTALQGIPSDCSDILVEGCTFEGRQNVNGYLLIGEQGVPIGAKLESVTVQGCTFMTTHWEPKAADIVCMNGRGVKLLDNFHYAQWIPGGGKVKAVSVGDDRTVADASELDGFEVIRMRTQLGWMGSEPEVGWLELGPMFSGGGWTYQNEPGASSPVWRE